MSPAADKLTIAIDGPAGSGKSTVSQLLARALGYKLVDTGAIYRCVALAATRRGLAPQDSVELACLVRSLAIDFSWVGDVNRVQLDGEDVTDAIRQPQISQPSSQFAAVPGVRAALLELQRRLAGSGGAVLEGRDIGTVVFPRAEVKFFLSATPEERARRRTAELQSKGLAADAAQILAEIRERDERDSSRAVAPLRAADDAIVVDSTSMDASQVVAFMLEKISRRTGARP
jgi:CMP/dCMP kinase